jgi:hypothetical protein
MPTSRKKLNYLVQTISGENCLSLKKSRTTLSHKKNHCLKVHKIEIFFGFDFEICIISLLIMSKY